MLKCVAKGCKVTATELPEGVQLVRFPVDSRLPVWIEKVRGKGSTWRPKPNSRLCTLHFDSQYFIGNFNYRRLLQGAIPTLNLERSTNPRPCGTSRFSNSPEKPHQQKPVKRLKVKQPNPAAKKKTQRVSESFNFGSMGTVAIPQKPGPKSKDINAILNYLNVEEDNYLNKILLEKSLKSLVDHVDRLCEHHKTNPMVESQWKSMSFILHKLWKNLSLSPDDAITMFETTIPESVYMLLRRLVKQDYTTQKKALVRSFALILHFFSPIAYDHVRARVKDAIPHPRTIQSWYTTIDKYMY